MRFHFRSVRRPPSAWVRCVWSCVAVFTRDTYVTVHGRMIRKDGDSHPVRFWKESMVPKLGVTLA